MKDFLPVEDLIVLCYSGMLGMEHLLCKEVICVFTSTPIISGMSSLCCVVFDT
jgi:hypothetical protein